MLRAGKEQLQGGAKLRASGPATVDRRGWMELRASGPATVDRGGGAHAEWPPGGDGQAGGLEVGRVKGRRWEARGGWRTGARMGERGGGRAPAAEKRGRCGGRPAAAGMWRYGRAG